MFTYLLNINHSATSANDARIY